MKIAKRVLLFILTNAAIVLTISVITSAIGLKPYLSAKGLDLASLAVFCVLWGAGGALLSLALSRVMAKWMMGVRLVDPDATEPELRGLVSRVHRLAERAGLKAMPEVGVYEADELNAFATGPTKSRSLVAVSTGLLRRMDAAEVEGVLAHEVAHIANGDMVTMTLLQGVINAFVMFLARIAGFFASQLASEDKRPIVQFGVVFALEFILGILGMIIVCSFSRAREFRADAGGASLSSRANMVAALERLKANSKIPAENDEQPALAAFKISGHASGFARLFSTHPDLDLRIARLQGVTDDLKSAIVEKAHGSAGDF